MHLQRAVHLALVFAACLFPSMGRAQPASYDLRDFDQVTPAKDQGAYGCCWAFAAIAGVESSMLKEGLATDPEDDSVDFSEAHLGRFHSNHDTADPLGGGGRSYTLGYFARGRGPILESDYPYPGQDGDPVGDYPRQCWVTAQRHIDPNNSHHAATFTDIKNAIMTYGAIESGMYWHNDYYDFDNHTYCYTGPEVGGHAISLVGWDNDKPTQGGTGAWLVKNSWGASSHENGYFWLSYNDTGAVPDATAYQTASKDTYSEILQNQTDAPVVWWNHRYGAARFTADEACFLKAVGIFVADYAAEYTVSVYDAWDVDGPSGLLHTESGILDWPGYHVLDLNSPVSVGAEDEFVVVYHLPWLDGSSGLGLIADNNSGNPADLTYCSFDGVTWTDMQGLNGILFLKAFTSPVPEPGSLVLLAVGGLCLAIYAWRRRFQHTQRTGTLSSP